MNNNKKANQSSLFSGFPNYILDKEELDKQYEDLQVKPNEYFENNIAFNVYSLRNDLKKLDQPVNKTKWGTQKRKKLRSNVP